MTPRAEHARETLLAHGDLHAAADIANTVIAAVNNIVNETGVPMGTSLLARALAVRGIESVAAEWWAEVARMPTPIAFEVMRSIAADPPPEVSTTTWSDEE